MSAALLALAVGLVVLTVVGVCVVAPLKAVHRDLLLPAAPLLGAALVVAVGSTTAYLWPAGGAVVATAVVCAVLLVLAARSGRARSLPSRQGLLVTAVTWAVGAVVAVVALLPNVWAGTADVVSPTDGNDAFFYVAESSWLAERPITPVPDPGAVRGAGNAVPADAPMRASLDFPLRIGQPFLVAVVSTLTGVDAVRATPALVALWAALLVPATWVAARAARVRPVPALAVAVLTGTAALSLQAVYQQTFDGVLGAALAVLTLGLGIAVPARRVPVWPAAVALAGLVGVYGEYLVLVVPAVVVGALAARRRLPARVGRLVLAGALSVALAPTAWVRALTALQLRRDGDSFGSPLFSDGWAASLARATGVAALGSPVPEGRRVLLLTAVLVAVVVVGWLGAVLLGPHRAAWAALLVLDLGYVAYLTVEHRGYTQVRVATLVLPLVLLAAGAGWSAWTARVGRAVRARRVMGRTARVLAVGAVAVAVAAVGVLNLRTAPSALDPERAASRAVDARYRTAAGWVEELGGPGGRDVSVLVGDLFAQMWLAHALRASSDVAYPSLRPDYLGTVRYWAGEPDPLLLVGPGAATSAPPEAVVREEHGLRLLDAARGDVLAAVPAEAPEWSPYAAADGRMYAVDGSSVLVLDPAAGEPGAVRLTLGALTDGEPVAATVRETGAVVRTLVAGGSAELDLPTDGRTALTVDIDLGADGTVGTSHFGLEGVSRAP